VWHAVLRLPTLQRICLVLRYYEHATDDEIANIAGMGAGAVNRQIARGLKRLAKDGVASAGNIERVLEQSLEQVADGARRRENSLLGVRARIQRKHEHHVRVMAGAVVALLVAAGIGLVIPHLGSNAQSSRRSLALPSGSPSPFASKLASPSPSPSASPSPSPSLSTCLARDLSLSITTDASAYDNGQPVTITRTVRNSGSQPCSTGGTGCLPSVSVVDYNGRTIWSSTPPGGGLCTRSEQKTLAPGDRLRTSYQWDQTECVGSGGDPCGGYPHAPAGNYSATTSWPVPGQDLTATSDSFFLSCCETSPSPTPSSGFTLIP
jgi:hypothetical protein